MAVVLFKFYYYYNLNFSNMKNQIFIKLILAVALLSNVKLLDAQTYVFSYSTGTYSDLTGNTSLNNGNTWDDSTFILPLGFSFNFYGSNYSTVEVDCNGFVSFDPGINTKMFCGFGADLMDKGDPSFGDGTGISKSDISYLLTGSAGSQILKIQFKNAAFFGSPNDYVNFQIWLYEASNKMEVIIGNNSVTDPAGSYGGSGGASIGVILANSSFTSMVYSLFANGSPATPTTAAWTNLINNPPTITGTPANGQVYTFTPSPAGVSELDKNGQLILYPNPVNDNLYVKLINLKGNEKFKLDILDVTGKIVVTESLNNNNNEGKINLSSLDKGYYLVRVADGMHVYRKKILKL